MSRNFSANQLEREFRPTRLGNWEVPKWLPQRPKARKTTTKIIANDRGHLLPGVQRPPQNPWGSFRGTWQLPNKISRKYASELTRPTGALTSWEKRSAHVPIIEPTKLPPARPRSAPNFSNSDLEFDDLDTPKYLGV
uniref:Cilia- and flagella-associated protein 126 n=1 Tax=Graphocephala atropunctata TaxID=36148 RepID=A0A1B6KXH3_9HEMI